MTTFSSLPVIFVAAGLVLLFAVAYLARLFRRHRRSLSALLRLAQTSLDPLQLPDAAWPALNDGGIKRFEYSGNWFGQAVKGSFGAAPEDCAPHPFKFSVAADGDVRLDFCFYSQNSRGEARLLAVHLAGVFHLLLETAVHSKMESLSAALAEQARLMLYLQHDLRNLAQWVEWLAADFGDAQNDAALLGIARRLHTSAPHAATRAQRILDAICKPPATLPPAKLAASLSDIILQAAEHAGIAITLNGAEAEFSVLLHRNLLERTLDNLFTHAAPLLRQEPDMKISVTLTQESDRVLARIKMPHLAGVTKRPPERLFEPFSSGHPGGLGLGLYQARKSLSEAGGELHAEVCQDHICFLLNLPSANYDSDQV